MICLKCRKPITDPSDVLDDGAGGMARLHRNCAVQVTSAEDVYNPDYQPTVVKGVWTGGQKPLIHLTGKVQDEHGRMVYPDELRKSDHPEYGASQCILCHRAISGDVGIVRSQNHVAHAECVQTLLAFVNQPEAPTVPTRPTTPAVKADRETASAVVKWAISELAKDE